jgi:hypothetical protein
MLRILKVVFVIDIELLLGTWKSGMDCLGAINRLPELIRTNKLDSKLKNENNCETNFGSRTAQVIMDAIDSSNIR